MGDSFFTGQNHYDESLKGFTSYGAEEVIEAAVRRMCSTRGNHATAVRLYRLADVVSGADVLPIEQLRKLGQPTPAKKVKRFSRRWAPPALCLLCGWMLHPAVEDLLQLLRGLR